MTIAWEENAINTKKKVSTIKKARQLVLCLKMCTTMQSCAIEYVECCVLITILL